MFGLRDLQLLPQFLFLDNLNTFFNSVFSSYFLFSLTIQFIFLLLNSTHLPPAFISNNAFAGK